MKIVCLGMAKNKGFDLMTEYNRKRMRHFLGEIDGKKIRIEIHLVKSTRSIKQNDMYWARIVPVFMSMFNKNLKPEDEKWDLEMTHEYLKKEFNYKLMRVGDDYIKIAKPSSSLSVGEFIEYIMRIEEYCEENGIYLPEVVDKDLVVMAGD